MMGNLDIPKRDAKEMKVTLSEHQKYMLAETAKRLRPYGDQILQGFIGAYKRRYPKTPEAVLHELSLLGHGLLSPAIQSGRVEVFFDKLSGIAVRLYEKKLPYQNISQAVQLIEQQFRKYLRHSYTDKDDLIEAIITVDELCHDCFDVMLWPYLKKGPSKAAFRSSSKHGLTRRECEVLRLVAEGYKSREIARALKLSVKTVEHHRASIKQKWGVSNVAQMVRRAIRQGLAG